jgi:glucokinase
MSDYRIGIDLGGTKIAGILVDAEGQIIAGPVEEATERDRPPSEILKSLVSLVEKLQGTAGKEVVGIGVGFPTTLDEQGGMVLCANLPTMEGVKIRRELEGFLGRAIALENDANCFVYGEWSAGSGKGTGICLGITLGTGIGTGLIINGGIYRGAHGFGGEICYSPFRDGRQVEDVVSGLRVAQRYRELSGDDADAAEVARRAREGDDHAVSVWREFGEVFGYALTYEVNIIDPDIVVLGGSLSAALDLFEESMQEVLKKHAYYYDVVNIQLSAFGKMAGAVGAAMLPTPGE